MTGNLLYLVGSTHNELAGSHYLEVANTQFSSFETRVPHVDIARSYATMKALGQAIRAGMLHACHDLSEGGLAVALAEIAMMSGVGVTLDLSRITIADMPEVSDVSRETKHDMLNIIRLFSESASRFVVVVAPEQASAFEQHMQGITDLTYLGEVSSRPFRVRDGENDVFSVSVVDLRKAWEREQREQA